MICQIRQTFPCQTFLLCGSVAEAKQSHIKLKCIMCSNTVKHCYVTFTVLANDINMFRALNEHT